ncbi:FHIPEP family type III secretion protein [Escherichia coli]
MIRKPIFTAQWTGQVSCRRGDAIAGILIMVINIVGGLLVGVLQHGMSMGHAAEGLIRY